MKQELVCTLRTLLDCPPSEVFMPILVGILSIFIVMTLWRMSK